MKRVSLSLFFLVLFFSKHILYAQNPLTKMWDARFGGNLDDRLTVIEQTPDGGYILGGFSSSNISGDKTQDTWGSSDFWMVKTDSLGNIQWDRTLGGTDEDALFSLTKTSDGGYILGGYSYSGISGDKTQNTWGNRDYWVVKTDSIGNKQWDKDFGGTEMEVLFSLQQTADGGYILGGYSYSGISGDKTQPNRDLLGNTPDYWVIKIDSLGNKQWDKTFGGTEEDWFYSLVQTADGGYLFAGKSFSGIGGDKSQPTQGISMDYWIVKTDSLGNKQWDKDFGGTDGDNLYAMNQTSDGGFILGGITDSGIGGDKSEPLRGLTDWWILKTDSLGNKQWDKDFGGTNTEDEFSSVTQTSDGGYLLAGTSYSAISGDKTEDNLGSEQSWVIKTDSLGNKQWDKTIFTAGHNETGLAIQTHDGCYAFANFDDGGPAGYRTQSSRGTSDYWMVKFCGILEANFTAVNSICPGTCTYFTNLSLNATSYQWFFPGASPDSSTDSNPTNICYANPGTYDVQLIATNANGSDTVLLSNYITVYPAPASQSITQNGDTLFAISGAAAYQWYFNGSIINGATNYFYVASAGGDFNVIVTDANGCEAEAAVFNVTAGLQSTVGSPQLTIFPNPAHDKFTIHNSQFTMGEPIEILVYNMVGEKVLAVQPQTSNFKHETNIALLSSGMYLVEIKAAEKMYHAKFVKQ